MMSSVTERDAAAPTPALPECTGAGRRSEGGDGVGEGRPFQSSLQRDPRRVGDGVPEPEPSKNGNGRCVWEAGNKERTGAPEFWLSFVFWVWARTFLAFLSSQWLRWAQGLPHLPVGVDSLASAVWLPNTTWSPGFPGSQQA